MNSPDTPLAIQFRGVTKRFGNVAANSGLDLRIESGTIHGIVGENGAGKSTAMKILYGLYQADAGEILVHGRSCRWSSPSDAIAAGIGMVHQHFMLAGPHSALDNIILGCESDFPLSPAHAVGRSVPPHPGPLPQGEGESLGSHSQFQRPSKRAPSPWGEGRGEGDRGIRTVWLRLSEKANLHHYRFGFINRGAARNRLDQLAEQYSLRVDWDRPVEDMPVGFQQRVEILKLLYREANILILDEPTGVLTPQETNTLFDNLERLRQQGKTIIFVTHKLREIMAFTDRVTVFRRGTVVGEFETSQTSPQQLAEMMVGRTVSLQVSVSHSRTSNVIGLEAIGLSHHRPGESRYRLREVNLQARCGEIVGIAGVEGNGQSELIQALLHPRDRACRSSGRVKILDHDVTDWPARRIRELDVAFIPEDRLHEGLLPDRPLVENFLLGQQNQSAFRRGIFLNRQSLESAAATAINDYDVRPPDLNAPGASLSGGNQQKLIVAREFHRHVRVLIAAQPTRGVDVGAIEFIHQKIVQARDDGAAVLLISSELEEILALSDRILVMYEGRIGAEFHRGRVTEAELGLKMGGAG